MKEQIEELINYEENKIEELQNRKREINRSIRDLNDKLKALEINIEDRQSVIELLERECE